MCIGNEVKFAFILDNFDNIFSKWVNDDLIIYILIILIVLNISCH